MKNNLKYILPIAIGLALLYWVFKDIDLVSLWQNFKDANYMWVGLAAILALLAHVLRAYRWKLMLEPMGYQPSTYNTTLAVLIGYLTNLALPRAGEFARSASLQKLEDIPFEKSFGAVIAERVIDVIVLFVLIGLNLLLEFDRLKGLFVEIFGDKLKNTSTLLTLAAGGLIFLGLVFFLLKKNWNKLENIPLVQKIIEIGKGLWNGFSSVKNLKNPAVFVIVTLLIWALYYWTTYFLYISLDADGTMSFLGILTILVMGSIGMAAPTMGGIGSYHFLVGKIVMLYGLTQQEGITLATFLHTMQGILFVLIFGVISLLLSFLAGNKAAGKVSEPS
ncbi:flippase-like domain-containing protein [Emticicia sp. CRIBPO]|uniref:lysylphosphatidylglycerol synthase transmembrane domain-containing protein n=1 Tax=Emticicia sp. CRIBPO TaxID=2683258 RepID=UPI0014133B7F|nr:lysylphosphatidylglycerol synthase transmembrane domain-containing protein [Emticicia sp. CRIBPO]NBA88165.1 flippase-like domain-containing protein [Emticicia sp. CRIBPO]